MSILGLGRQFKLWSNDNWPWVAVIIGVLTLLPILRDFVWNPWTERTVPSNVRIASLRFDVDKSEFLQKIRIVRNVTDPNIREICQALETSHTGARAATITARLRDYLEESDGENSASVWVSARIVNTGKGTNIRAATLFLTTPSFTNYMDLADVRRTLADGYPAVAYKTTQSRVLPDEWLVGESDRPQTKRIEFKIPYEILSQVDKSLLVAGKDVPFSAELFLQFQDRSWYYSGESELGPETFDQFKVGLPEMTNLGYMR